MCVRERVCVKECSVCVRLSGRERDCVCERECKVCESDCVCVREREREIECTVTCDRIVFIRS